MLSSLANYSHFVYTIPDRFPSVKRSTLILKPMGAAIGELEGRLDFAPGLTFDQPNLPLLIREIEETLLTARIRSLRHTEKRRIEREADGRDAPPCLSPMHIPS